MRHPGLEMLEHGSGLAIARAIEHVAATLPEGEPMPENGSGIVRARRLLRVRP